MKDLRQAILSLNGRVCALESGVADRLTLIVGDMARGVKVPAARLADAVPFESNKHSMFGHSVSRLPTKVGGRSIAIISARGVALYDFEMQPFAFSTRRLAMNVAQAAADPQVGVIVLDIASPGGQVTGTPEAADAVFAARKSKKVVALIDPMAASAAYWIASQATEIVATPSGDVGSIGVFMLHVDYSKMLDDAGIKPTFIKAGEHKTEGNSFEPLSDSAKAHFQSEVDKTHRQFLAAVARGRGVSVETVASSFGRGRLVEARDAKRLGMIDAIAAPDAAIAQIVDGRGFRASADASLSADAAARARRLAILSA